VSHGQNSAILVRKKHNKSGSISIQAIDKTSGYTIHKELECRLCANDIPLSPRCVVELPQKMHEMTIKLPGDPEEQESCSKWIRISIKFMKCFIDCLGVPFQKSGNKGRIQNPEFRIQNLVNSKDGLSRVLRDKERN
jgi:hypothetical protein